MSRARHLWFAFRTSALDKLETSELLDMLRYDPMVVVGQEGDFWIFRKDIDISDVDAMASWAGIQGFRWRSFGLDIDAHVFVATSRDHLGLLCTPEEVPA